MKPSALVLALIATVSVLAAEPAPVAATPAPAPAAATPATDEVARQLAATLASIREQSVARAPENQKEAAPVDPDVLELPKMTVKQQPKPRVRLGEGSILGPKAFNEDLAKKNLSTLDRSILNKFTLPLFGTSAADRAREDYNIAQKQQFMSDVLTISKAAEQTDPAAAKALREAAAKP
jgi:hypothetical protein